MKTKITVTLLIILMCCTGCLRGEMNIIDELAIIIAMGFETFPEEDPDKVTITTINPLFGERAEDQTRLMSVSGFGLAGAMDNWQRFRNREMAIGKVQLIVFGENLTNQGIIEKTQDLRQIPDIEVRSDVVYFPGDPKDILALKPPEEQRIGTYITDNLRIMDQEGFSPQVTLHDLWTNILTEGRDPFMPMVEIEENENTPYFSGMALLDENGKLATILDFAESKLLYMLLARHSNPTMTTKINGGEELGEGLVIFKISSSEKEIKTNLNNEELEITIVNNIKMSIEEIEVRGAEVLTEESFEIFSDEIAADLTLAITALIEKLQNANTDPLGLGHFVRIQQTEYYHQGTWREDYPNIDIKVETNIETIRGTTFERTY
ncbi:Ger(x)C family spore germination protein [Proteinivorax tanatarense]|uniref:Ger(X)C family spore germination protein n=1 Tax=Proteinivorax tanatarense TaxID=1260629 RepID=A0AAU7VMR1_9FIRM